jgi:hypothetical protein
LILSEGDYSNDRSNLKLPHEIVEINPFQRKSSAGTTRYQYGFGSWK